MSDTYTVENIYSGSEIIIDGPFSTIISENLHKEFSDQSNCDQIVNKIRDTALNIFKKGKDIVANPTINHNLLVVGKVQSGKTSNLEYLTGICFDNGYNTVIIYGGYDKILTDQAYKRFKEAFNSNSEVNKVSVECTLTSSKWSENIDNNMLETEYFDNNGRLIIIAMKAKKHLDEVNKFLKNVNRGLIKAFIIDDEGDQASLNTKYKRNEISAIYGSIVKMKEILSNPLYLSVTATPHALLLIPNNSELFPQDVALIYPGNGYDGCEKFHLDDSHICYVESEDNNVILSEVKGLPKSLIYAINYYLIVSALMIKRGIRKSQMVIHVDETVAAHDIIYGKVEKYIDPIKNVMIEGDKSDIDRILHRFKEAYCNIFDKEPNLLNVDFDDIVNELIVVVKSLYLIKQDGTGKQTMTNLDKKSHQIVIGAQLLSRGVTFKQLVVTYFTRWPKSFGNMDTSMQRARWLGYRGKFIDLCKVFCTKDIALKFSILSDIEIDLWDQLEQIDRKELSLQDILINGEEELKLRPSRSNVTSCKVISIGRNWINQRYIVDQKDIALKNNGILDEIIRGKTLNKSSIGRTDGKTSCYYCYISFEEFSKIFNDTVSIFDKSPFNVLDLSISEFRTKKIILELFWDPEDASEFKVRTRTYYMNDEYSSITVSALQQGASNVDSEIANYKGDANVIVDGDSVIIQVFRIKPKECKWDTSCYNYMQYMYSIHIPKLRIGYIRGDK